MPGWSRLIAAPVPAGTVLFITRTWPSPSPQLLDHGPHPREVGVAGRRSAGCRRRRRAGGRRRAPRPRSVVKVIRSALRATQLVEARLVDRRLAAPQRLDLLGDDVAGDDRVAELGEAGGGDQADPADPDHPDRLSLRRCHRPAFLRLRLRVGDDHLRGPRHADHLVVGQGVEQVVGDPVGVVAAMPGDHA